MTNISTRLFRYRHIPWFYCAYTCPSSRDIFTAAAPLFDLLLDIKLWGGYDVIRVGAVAGIICNRITCGRGYPHSWYHQNITWMCICRVYTYNKAYLQWHNEESFKKRCYANQCLRKHKIGMLVCKNYNRQSWVGLAKTLTVTHLIWSLRTRVPISCLLNACLAKYL